jgi:hypothetical protein
MRVGFLFNHDQIHQIAHSLPIARALAELAAKTGSEVEIVIATTQANLATEVRRQLGPDRPRGLTLIDLRLKSPLSKLFSTLLGRILPAAKLLVYRDNLAFFRALDGLVVTERTSLILKTRYGLKKPLMILADHGAGDRAIAFGKAVALFDHILAAGPKLSARFQAEAGVAPERISITGYPKFDATEANVPPAPLFANSRPTVLYNPHLSPHLSSWYRQGRAVLDFFLDSPDYNLIFAPHIMLFQRKMVLTIDKFRADFPGRIDPKYRAARNIHIDLGSLASTDMTYTNAADIYLGDASSQIYEFLKRPRPCVFLNPHGHPYQGDPNFAHWQAGPVIETVADLGRALKRAQDQQDAVYRPVQKALFDFTFDLTDEPSSLRASRVLMDVLKGRDRSTKTK